MSQSKRPKTDSIPINRNDLIKLSVKNLEFVCSRTELKASSEFFNVLLSRYYKEDDGVITLKEVDGNTMQELLQLVRNKSHSVQSCDLPGVIILCDMFLCENLKNQLISEAIHRLSRFNCLKIWMKLEMLSLIPLVWKAKSLSLTTFAHQRDMGSINDLKLPELMTYLGHPNLQCGKEINVFYCIIDWINQKQKGICKSCLREILVCINYKDISLSELREMKTHSDVSENKNIVNILEYITRLKCGEVLNVENANFKTAQIWFNPRGRYLPEYLFVFNADVGHDIFYHGHHTDTFIRKVATICSKSIDGLTGGEVQVYNKKVYIFGGEISMGKGLWNENFWEFDLDTKQLINTKYGIPKRRHFKSCIVGHDLFIIGGTGPYRLKKNDMLWFSFSRKKWKEKAIPLPCCPTSFKYCNFNGELFILDCPNKHGYIFQHHMPWKSVMISATVKELIEEYSSFSMFAYRGNLFLKGKRLLELELVDYTLVLKKVCDLPHISTEILIDTSVSNNRVYSMYADQMYGDIKLQYLDLDNLESVFIEKVGLHHDSCVENKDCIIVETEGETDKNSQMIFKYNPNKMIKMFFLHDYKYCDFEDLLVGDV